MNNGTEKILIYGIGNPGRQDDGLGILFVEEIEKWVKLKGLTNIETTQNYQLNIEDAEKISHYDLVIFADASIETEQSFKYELIKPSTAFEFSMHSIAPALILGLCQNLFSKNLTAYQIHIKGERWKFMKPISSKAGKNLRLALDFIKNELDYKLISERSLN